MSKLFTIINQAELAKDVRNLIVPTKIPSDDPILGSPPEIVYRWNTFTKKHGTLLERVMTKVIQSSTGWQSASQKRFKCDNSETKNLIDRIAINRKHEVAIFVECKRNLGNVSGPYLGKIRSYDKWVSTCALQIGSELGFKNPNALVKFAVFNAYGEVSSREVARGIPVLTPTDLPRIFGNFALEVFDEFNEFVDQILSESPVLENLLRKTRSPDIIRKQSNLSYQNELGSDAFREKISVELSRLTYA